MNAMNTQQPDSPIVVSTSPAVKFPSGFQRVSTFPAQPIRRNNEPGGFDAIDALAFVHAYGTDGATALDIAYHGGPVPEDVQALWDAGAVLPIGSWVDEEGQLDAILEALAEFYVGLVEYVPSDPGAPAHRRSAVRLTPAGRSLIDAWLFVRDVVTAEPYLLTWFKSELASRRRTDRAPFTLPAPAVPPVPSADPDLLKLRDRAMELTDGLLPWLAFDADEDGPPCLATQDAAGVQHIIDVVDGADIEADVLDAFEEAKTAPFFFVGIEDDHLRIVQREDHWPTHEEITTVLELIPAESAHVELHQDRRGAFVCAPPHVLEALLSTLLAYDVPDRGMPQASQYAPLDWLPLD